MTGSKGRGTNALRCRRTRFRLTSARFAIRFEPAGSPVTAGARSCLTRIMKLQRSLGGCVVVITGASSGIGLATALAFARRGASLALGARRTEALERAAEACETAGGRAIAVTTDVTDENSVAQLAEAAVARFGRIDVWINNAGVGLFGP